MASPTLDNLQTVIERLERLERQNRTLKIVMILAIAAVGAILSMAQAPARQRVIEAQEFVLRDTRGNSRGVWSVAGDSESELTFSDSAGRSELSLLASREQSNVVVFDDHTKPRVVLGMVGGQPSLVLNSPGGTPLLVEEPSMGIHFIDANGTSQMSLGPLLGGPGLSISDPTGKLRMVIQVKGEDSRLVAFDSRDNERLALGVSADLPMVLLQESYDKTRLALIGFQDRPGLVAYDDSGTAFYRVP